MPWALCGRVLAGYYIDRRDGPASRTRPASHAAVKMAMTVTSRRWPPVGDMNQEIIMKRFMLMLLASCAVSAAEAADPAAPVNEIMQEAVKGWAEDAQPGEDYFSEARLQRIYSQDFAKVYHEAAKFPAYDEGDSPFDYDVVVSGQDSCAIKDLSVATGAQADGKSDVKVTFDNTHCLGERTADWKPNELHFMVIEENGRAVIDDIVRTGDAGSLKTELQGIASQGAGAQ
jgi:hypothetical protein